MLVSTFAIAVGGILVRGKIVLVSCRSVDVSPGSPCAALSQKPRVGLVAASKRWAMNNTSKKVHNTFVTFANFN